MAAELRYGCAPATRTQRSHNGSPGAGGCAASSHHRTATTKIVSAAAQIHRGRVRLVGRVARSS